MNNTRPNDWEVVRTMERFGGSFVKTLARLCDQADADNLQRIKATWPEYWQQYGELARLKKEQDRLTAEGDRVFGVDSDAPTR